MCMWSFLGQPLFSSRRVEKYVRKKLDGQQIQIIGRLGASFWQANSEGSKYELPVETRNLDRLWNVMAVQHKSPSQASSSSAGSSWCSSWEMRRRTSRASIYSRTPPPRIGDQLCAASACSALLENHLGFQEKRGLTSEPISTRWPCDDAEKLLRNFHICKVSCSWVPGRWLWRYTSLAASLLAAGMPWDCATCEGKGQVEINVLSILLVPWLNLCSVFEPFLASSPCCKQHTVFV